MTPAAEGHNLPSEIMDLFECLDLLGGSLSDLDLQDTEPALLDEDDTAPLTGRPVRSLVEWVKGHTH